MISKFLIDKCVDMRADPVIRTLKHVDTIN